MADNTSENSTPDYMMGYVEDVIEILSQRTAETDAAYLLPHLRPGMRILDVGCGPGSISVGLAAAVAPGRISWLRYGANPDRHRNLGGPEGRFGKCSVSSW